MNDHFDNTWLLQAQNALYGLATPEGMVALLFLLALFGFCLSSRAVRLSVMAFMIWVSSLGFFRIGARLVPPIEQIRTYGRGLTTALLFLLVLPALTSFKGWRSRTFAGASAAYFAFEMLFSFREMVGGSGDFKRFLLAGVLYLFTFVVFGYGLTRWIQNMQDFNRIAHYLGVAIAIFCGGIFIQLLVNRSMVQDDQGRLAGTTGNPQHCAVILGMSLPMLCYLVVRRGQKFRLRIGFGALAALAGILLLWTGSRTGNLMAAIGIVFLFRLRLGRAAILGIFAAVFVMIYLSIFSNSDIVSSHLLSGQDTRSGVWATQWSQFLHNPIMGTIGEEDSFGLSENSYLATAARYGVLGLIPLLAVIGIVIHSMYRLHKYRKNLGDDILAADVVVACIVAIATGAWFEAYLLGTVTYMVFFIYAILGMLNGITEIAMTPQVQEQGQAVVNQDGYYHQPQMAGAF